VPLDWARVDLQRVALQGSGEDAPALLRVYEFTVHILVFVFFLDEVQAVVHEAQRYTGRFHAPVIERSEVLASEREDSLVCSRCPCRRNSAIHSCHPTRVIEQRQPEPVASEAAASGRGLGVEHDDLALRVCAVIPIVEHAEEQPAGRENKSASGGWPPPSFVFTGREASRVVLVH
jgi:hypothetical protein